LHDAVVGAGVEIAGWPHVIVCIHDYDQRNRPSTLHITNERLASDALGA
jgi:hypothetical protein